jgi:hypothetical protein
MNWIYLSSSNLRAAAYDVSNATIYIEFKNGSRYAYPSTSISLFQGLINAGSPGTYHAQYIKHLPFRRL